MSLLERSSEIVARQVDRRSFLLRISTMTFGAVAAAAVGLPGTTTARAANACERIESENVCVPPGFGLCTGRSASYCSGAACAGGCTYNYKLTYHQTACWCTQKSCTACGTPGAFCGYYKCCDCICPSGGSCACQEFHYTCNPCGTSASFPCIPCC